ncbi:MAG: prepilin-type N-terminal cleavage/methylation domain-containing protein [Pseudomonadota bacterium]
MRHRSNIAGFSLLEIMLALALVSVVLTVSVRSGVNMVMRWQLSSQVKTIVNTVNSFSVTAYTRSREMSLSELVQQNVELPSDWMITILEDATFSRAGYCERGAFQIEADNERVFNYVLDPQTCRAVEVAA